MEVISSGHVYVEDIILDPDPMVCCSVVRLYVYELESRWKFMVQHLIGETLGVCGTPVFGGAVF